jgi:hypothetical protein
MLKILNGNVLAFYMRWSKNPAFDGQEFRHDVVKASSPSNIKA